MLHANNIEYFASTSGLKLENYELHRVQIPPDLFLGCVSLVKLPNPSKPTSLSIE